MNYFEKFQARGGEIRSISKKYLLSLRSLAAFAAYIATVKIVDFSVETSATLEYKNAMKESKDLSREWINNPYLNMIDTPKDVSIILSKMQDFLDSALSCTF